MNPSSTQPGTTTAPPTASSLQASHWQALSEASKILNSTLDLDRLLELILEVATRELKADRGTVYLVYKEEGELRAKISQGIESRLLRVKIGQGISGRVAQTGETIRIEDAYQDARFATQFDNASGYRTRSMMCVPIQSKTEEIIGVIQLLNKTEGTFTLEDEIFLLALTVHIAIALENARLHAQIVDQQRIRTELGLARQIQQNLLRPPPPIWHNYQLAAKAEPCYEVGGDFYDFLPISQNVMWMVIADVSGKGISSALVMSTLQATLRALLVGVHSFERLLGQLNSMVRDFTGSKMYVTMFLCMVDSENRKLHYINAGHNPPVLIRSDGSYEELEAGGTVVGLLPGVKFARSHTELEPGDVLVLYTDGLAETDNPAGEMYGIEGIVRSVQASRQSGSPEVILQRILTDVKEFAAGAPPADDRTLIVLTPARS